VLQLLQLLDHLKFLFGLLIVFEIFFCALDGEFPLAEQVVNDLEIFDVVRTEKAITFSIFPRL
jgi:hypothetical protein